MTLALLCAPGSGGGVVRGSGGGPTAGVAPSGGGWAGCTGVEEPDPGAEEEEFDPVAVVPGTMTDAARAFCFACNSASRLILVWRID